VRTLYLTLFGMTLLFAGAMSFATLSVYTDTWWPGVVAGGLLVVFLAVGAAIPVTMRSLTGTFRRAARAALVMFSSWWGLAFFVMALVTWILGKRSVGPNNAYLTLGLLIFLGFVGMGIQGAIAMTAWFVDVRNRSIVVPARRARLEPEAQLHAEEPEQHGSSLGHTASLSQA